MIPKQAIEKAIEGGWESNLPSVVAKSVDDHKEALHADILTKIMWAQFAPLAVCDPTFWQSLGKELGWSEVTPGNAVMSTYFPQTWRYNALRFYDLILTGGDTEEFWVKLLTPTHLE